MNAAPPISVVMSVRNGAANVEQSARSVLAQTCGDFEFLIVDDGSTDETPDILSSLQGDDSRIRVLTQDGRGLTRSLIRGCSEARGEFIARQDAGDESMPGRLASLADVLAERPDVGFACGSTRVVGPGGEDLYVSRSAEAERNVCHRIGLGEDGPSHHGAVMFRRGHYERVGGYREAFAMAQDWDLWFRLIEISRFCAVDEIHYLARVDPFGISMSARIQQRRYGALAAEGHRLREMGRFDSEVYATAAALGQSTVAPGNPADGFYFLGSLLMERANPACRKYLLEAWRRNPWSLKIWYKLLRSSMLRAA